MKHLYKDEENSLKTMTVIPTIYYNDDKIVFENVLNTSPKHFCVNLKLET